MNTTGCVFWPDDPSKCWTVLVLFQLFSVVSLIGCLFIVITIILFRLYQYFVQRLILFMSLSAFMKTLSNMFTVIDYPKLCVTQAFLVSVFSWAELLWVCCITANLVMVIHGISSEIHEKWFHTVTWFLSLIIGLVPFIGHHYGPAGIWCWIDREATGLRFGLWYVPLLLVVVSMALVYIFICVRSFCSTNFDEGFWYDEQQRRMLQDEVTPLIAYPVIYLLFTLPVLIYRIDDAVHPDEPPKFVLLTLSAITTPMLGGINALAFALYEDSLKLLSWNNIKGALLSWKNSSDVRVTHNYKVDDSTLDDSQTLLYRKGNGDIKVSSFKRDRYDEGAV